MSDTPLPVRFAGSRPGASDGITVAEPTSRSRETTPTGRAILDWREVTRGEAVIAGLVLALAALIRLAWVLTISVTPESDFATFLSMAREIAHGRWPSETYGWIYQGPGYPLLLAPVVALGGGVSAIELVNVTLQLATVAVCWLLARRLFGPMGGIVAAGFAAVLPGLWSYTALIAAESLGSLLLITISLLYLSDSRGGAIGMGLCGGFLAVVRPAFLPYLVVLAFAMLVAYRGSLRRLAPFVAGVLLVMAPILALNVAGGGPAFPTAASGWQTWLVNNERATGAWFPAAERDDFPFAGLPDDDETRAAQRKLGLQFIVANPIPAARNAWHRYAMNWSEDRTGLFWTADRIPPDERDDIPFVDRLAGWADRLYALVLVFAVVTAIRCRARSDILVPLVAPLGYIAAVLAAAEANGRYHAIALPVLCVIAGGAVPGARSGIVPVLRSRVIRFRGRANPIALVFAAVVAALLIAWIVWNTGRLLDWLAPHWLVLVTVLAPLAWQAIAVIPRIARYTLADTEHHPTRSRVAVIAMVAGVILIGVVGGRWLGRTIDDVAAVAPNGWDRFEMTPAGETIEMPIRLQSAGTPPGLHQVSYPDAVELDFASDVAPGTVTGVTRTLTDLQPGETYRFYLHVYDPGVLGDPSERLTISIDGRVVWQREPDRADEATWLVATLPWTATSDTATIRVERTAGTDAEARQQATPAIRTLHLYSRY